MRRARAHAEHRGQNLAMDCASSLDGASWPGSPTSRDGRTFSFEFFPPQTDAAQLSLGRTIAELEPLGPSFVSVTYGAGGSTRQRTHEVVAWVRRETAITPMAHLTCAGHRRVEIAEILASYQAAGIENILALGGDQPQHGAELPASDYGYAAELVEDVRRGAPSASASRPPGGPSPLAEPGVGPPPPRGQAGPADFAITQFFFDAATTSACRRARGPRRHQAVMPGHHARDQQGTGGPHGRALRRRLPRLVGGTTRAGHRPGRGPAHRVEVATTLCADLLDTGAPGLHFYTLNRSSATREIYANLGLPVAAG
jgi:methylenetetrahydrofolate reductase (NADPH)